MEEGVEMEKHIKKDAEIRIGIMVRILIILSFTIWSFDHFFIILSFNYFIVYNQLNIIW